VETHLSYSLHARRKLRGCPTHTVVTFSSLPCGLLLFSGQSDVISSVANFASSLYVCRQERQIRLKWIEEFSVDCNVGVAVASALTEMDLKENNV
jgi:hypothetical protein